MLDGRVTRLRAKIQEERATIQGMHLLLEGRYKPEAFDMCASICAAQYPPPPAAAAARVAPCLCARLTRPWRCIVACRDDETQNPLLDSIDLGGARTSLGEDET